ncbi:MAG: hypothetical protein G8345_16330 [Magnetococcales bacterium]|nr:hypothetical protein [Magnetococcales bacterium]NGZ28443.1 hypothetical protein [Magnetococcales bacterium]
MTNSMSLAILLLGVAGIVIAYGWWRQRGMLRELSIALEHEKGLRLQEQQAHTLCQEKLAAESRQRQQEVEKLATTHRWVTGLEESLTAFANAISALMITVDAAGRILAWSGDGQNLPVHPQLRNKVGDWLPTTERENFSRFLNTLVQQRSAPPFWLRMPGKEGKEQRFCLCGTPHPHGSEIFLVLFNPHHYSEKVDGHCRLHQVILQGKNNQPGWLDASQRIDAVLMAQVEGAIQDTAAAAMQIFRESSAISDDMDGLNRFLSDSRQHSIMLGSNSQQMIAQDQAGLQSFKEFMSRQSHFRQQEEQNVRQAILEVQKLANLTEKVLNLSDKTKVLAINAGIVAARAGTHGKQFTVVAHEVRAMAEQTAQVAREIEQGIVQSAQQVERALMQSIHSTAAKEQEERLLSAAGQMDRLGHHFGELLTFTTATMGKITESSQSVAHKVTDLISYLQFQDIVRQRLEQVIATIRQRTNFQDQLNRCMKDPNTNSELLYYDVDAMLKDYVMAKQRDAHRATLGKTVHSPDHEDEGAIILF